MRSVSFLVVLNFVMYVMFSAQISDVLNLQIKMKKSI